MVVGPINDFVASKAGGVLIGLVLLLTGLNHILNPDASLVAQYLPDMGRLVYQAAGVVVGSAGLTQLNMELDLY